MADFVLKKMDAESLNATQAPAFVEEVATSMYLIQTIRDPNTGILCLSSSEFYDPSKESDKQ